MSFLNIISSLNISFAITGLFLGIGLGIYTNLAIYAKKDKDIGKFATFLLCVAFGILGIFIGGFLPNIKIQ